MHILLSARAVIECQAHCRCDRSIWLMTRLNSAHSLFLPRRIHRREKLSPRKPTILKHFHVEISQYRPGRNNFIDYFRGSDVRVGETLALA